MPAQVIPFPERPAPDPQARLRAALAGLDQALANERDAVAAWRQGLAELHGGMEALGRSLRAYHGRLGALDAGLARLGTEARALERVSHAALYAPLPPSV